MSLPELVQPKRHLKAVTTAAETPVTPMPKRRTGQKRKSAVLYTAADVKRLHEECDRLAAGLAQQFGVAVNLNVVDFGNLHAKCEAGAVAHLLVSKGIITGEEMEAAFYGALKTTLAQALMAKENERLQERQRLGGIQAVRGPKIITATH